MKRIHIKATTTVRRTGNHVTATTRVSNGSRTRTYTKTVRVPK